MVCFCEDCRANDGSEERPYYASNSLKVIHCLLKNKVTRNKTLDQNKTKFLIRITDRDEDPLYVKILCLKK